ncbi:MAG TPA: hypothetical protein VGR84_18005, partial [Candidatus Acidoferrales bacterium]|nr:hypothetical protein [Candidatus Acidoferrales bacterium]
LAEQLKDLFHRVGRAYWPVRVNLHLAPEVISGLAAKFKKAPSEFAGKHVKRADRIDGLQLIFGDESWVLMRPSGTEPLVRVYAEAETPERSKQIAEEARKWITA